MRAFTVAWRAIRSWLNELGFLAGMSLLWFITGGIMVVAAVLLGWPMAIMGGPWWLAPLLAIPIGPATVALAVVARRCASELRVDRSFYFNGLRAYWRPALGLSAIGMIVLTLVLMNLVFYASRSGLLDLVLTFTWLYLLLFWLSVQFYVYPALIRLEKPRALAALRTAALGAWANPLFSFLLLALAAVLTGISIALTFLVFLVWPALMVLLGEHSFKLFLERAGVKEEE
jgi:hypothetical protein